MPPIAIVLVPAFELVCTSCSLLCVGVGYMGGCVSGCAVRFLKDFTGVLLNATYIEVMANLLKLH